MLKKCFFILVCTCLSTACVQQPVKKKVENYDHLTVFVKDGDYKCYYHLSYDSHNFGQFPEADYTTGLKEGLLLKIRRISDYEASLEMIFPNGRVVSSNGLRLQKREHPVTRYEVEADFMGRSGRPGLAFWYGHLPNGDIGVEAGILFVYPMVVVETFGCMDLNAKTIFYDEFALPIPANSEAYRNYTTVANEFAAKLPISDIVGVSSEINKERVRDMLAYVIYMVLENDIEKLCINMNTCQRLGKIAEVAMKGDAATEDEKQKYEKMALDMGLKDVLNNSELDSENFIEKYKKQLVEKYSTPRKIYN